MHDNDSRGLEDPARADASPSNTLLADGGERPDGERERSERDPHRDAKRSDDGSRSSSDRRSDGGEPSTTRRSSSALRADGGTGWVDLTAFQRDCLEAVVRLERDGERCREAEITRELERTYPKLNHNRLYPNLTVLVGRGLLERRGRADDRVEYAPTDAGRTLLRRRVERLADTCGLVMIDRSGDGAARGRGDG